MEEQRVARPDARGGRECYWALSTQWGVRALPRSGVTTTNRARSRRSATARWLCPRHHFCRRISRIWRMEQATLPVRRAGAGRQGRWMVQRAVRPERERGAMATERLSDAPTRSCAATRGRSGPGARTQIHSTRQVRPEKAWLDVRGAHRTNKRPGASPSPAGPRCVGLTTRASRQVPGLFALLSSPSSIASTGSHLPCSGNPATLIKRPGHHGGNEPCAPFS